MRHHPTGLPACFTETQFEPQPSHPARSSVHTGNKPQPDGPALYPMSARNTGHPASTRPAFTGAKSPGARHHHRPEVRPSRRSLVWKPSAHSPCPNIPAGGMPPPATSDRPRALHPPQRRQGRVLVVMDRRSGPRADGPNPDGRAGPPGCKPDCRHTRRSCGGYRDLLAPVQPHFERSARAAISRHPNRVGQDRPRPISQRLARGIDGRQDEEGRKDQGRRSGHPDRQSIARVLPPSVADGRNPPVNGTPKGPPPALCHAPQQINRP